MGFEDVTGSLPVDERAGIDHFTSVAIPAIERFVSEMQALSDHAWHRVASYPTSRFARGKSESGMVLADVHYNAITNVPMDVQLLVRVGDRILLEAGFNTAQIAEREGGAVRLIWRDEYNGGMVWVTTKPNSHTGLMAASGVRPLVTVRRHAYQ